MQLPCSPSPPPIDFDPLSQAACRLRATCTGAGARRPAATASPWAGDALRRPTCGAASARRATSARLQVCSSAAAAAAVGVTGSLAAVEEDVAGCMGPAAGSKLLGDCGRKQLVAFVHAPSHGRTLSRRGCPFTPPVRSGSHSTWLGSGSRLALGQPLLPRLGGCLRCGSSSAAAAPEPAAVVQGQARLLHRAALAAACWCSLPSRQPGFSCGAPVLLQVTCAALRRCLTGGRHPGEGPRPSCHHATTSSPRCA